MADDSLFPSLMDDEPSTISDTAPNSIGYNEVSLTIKTLTSMAAACALVGDIEMGKAYMRASTEILQVCMTRWPTRPMESVEQMVTAAANAIREDAKGPSQTENAMTTITVKVPAGEKRAIQVNASNEYILIGPDEEREFAVSDDGSVTTVAVHPGNRYEGGQQTTEEETESGKSGEAGTDDSVAAGAGGDQTKTA